MGSRTFDFLTESFLFYDSLIRDQFRDIPESEIVAELKRYRQFCLSVAPEIEAEILSSPISSLRLFSGIKHVGVDLLKQATFYVHQHILYDPLFRIDARNESGGETNYTCIQQFPWVFQTYSQHKKASESGRLSPCIASDGCRELCETTANQLLF